MEKVPYPVVAQLRPAYPDCVRAVHLELPKVHHEEADWYAPQK